MQIYRNSLAATKAGTKVGPDRLGSLDPVRLLYLPLAAGAHNSYLAVEVTLQMLCSHTASCSIPPQQYLRELKAITSTGSDVWKRNRTWKRWTHLRFEIASCRFWYRRPYDTDGSSWNHQAVESSAQFSLRTEHWQNDRQKYASGPVP